MGTSRPSRAALLACVLAAALATAACSGSSDDSGKDDASPSPTGPRTTVVFEPAAAAGERELAAVAERIRNRALAAGREGVDVRVADGAVTVSAVGVGRDRLTWLGRSGDLAFRPVLASRMGTGTAAPGTPQELRALDCAAPPGPAAKNDKALACAEDGTGYWLEPAALGEEDVTAAKSRYDQNGGGWLVDMELTDRGGARFAELSGDLAARQPPGNQMAIVLDGHVLSAPAVQQRIEGGRVQIAGSLTRDEAEELAVLITEGTLPVPLKPPPGRESASPEASG
ncbi:SecDF P1 head subdomain-containing protein [Streptomyces capparidis]